MIHKVMLSVAALAVAQPALAGGLAPIVEEPQIIVVEPQGSPASSGAQIIIPIVGLILLCAALCGGSDDDDEQTGGGESNFGSLGEDILDLGTDFA